LSDFVRRETSGSAAKQLSERVKIGRMRKPEEAKKHGNSAVKPTSLVKHLRISSPTVSESAAYSGDVTQTL
jgi:hypothetical protein